ncbi:MAG: hypothetical protein AAF675_05555 [Pseudomonadota bacterium]
MTRAEVDQLIEEIRHLIEARGCTPSERARAALFIAGIAGIAAEDEIGPDDAGRIMREMGEEMEARSIAHLPVAGTA